jgi:hypothetical protein
MDASGPPPSSISASQPRSSPPKRLSDSPLRSRALPTLSLLAAPSCSESFASTASRSALDPPPEAEPPKPLLLSPASPGSVRGTLSYRGFAKTANFRCVWTRIGSLGERAKSDVPPGVPRDRGASRSAIPGAVFSPARHRQSCSNRSS